MNSATQALQDQINAGESFTIPPGVVQIDDWLDVYSIGQHIRGSGVNRTVIQQMTQGKGVFRLHRHEQGNNPGAFTWRGPYAGGNGLHHVRIGEMTLGTLTQTGDGIIHSDGVDWDGDFLYFHDLITYGFENHIHMNGLAHLRLERVVCSNATAEQTRWGTGVKCYGATPNSHFMEAVTLSGFDIGADLFGFGLKGNFGDVGLCNTGLRLNGVMTIEGGRFEMCNRYIDIGTSQPSHINLRGMHLGTDPQSQIHPIRMNSGSILNGSAVVGASGKELVECMNWYDHPFIDNHPSGFNFGGNDYYFVQNAMGGIRARFSPWKLVQDDADLSTMPPNAGNQGTTFRVHNGGLEKWVTCIEDVSNPGNYIWQPHW